MKIVDYQTAKALQALGYDGEYTKTYADFDTCTVDVTGLKIPSEIPVPRLDDVAYWLRDKHQLSIEVGVTMSKCWAAYIYDYADDVMGQFCEIYDDYNSALEAAVTKAIEKIKDRQYDSDRT